MTDSVDQLQFLAERVAQRFGSDDTDMLVYVSAAVCAEIERLRAKVERLESRGINDMQHKIAEQAAEIERLLVKLRIRAERAERAEAQRDRLAEAGDRIADTLANRWVPPVELLNEWQAAREWDGALKETP